MDTSDRAHEEKVRQLRRLQEVVETLRGPDGCPWDREQTLGSLSKNFLEEACEVIDAIDRSPESSRSSSDAICEELGDLLMNIVLAARVAEEEDGFSLADVAREITAKLIRRHPHVFGDEKIDDTDAVLERWKEIKAQEKADGLSSGAAFDTEEPPSILDDVPKSLPPIAAAFSLGKKAAQVGFDWPDTDGPKNKIHEEIRELEGALSEGAAPRIEHEIGDLLLAVVNFSRKAGIAPDTALRKANRRFRRRFQSVEMFLEQSKAAGKTPSLEEMEARWQAAKRSE